jgi:hypothetical protein
MRKISNDKRATHTAQPTAANLELPKGKPTAEPAVDPHEEINAEQITPAVEIESTPNAVNQKAIRDLVACILPHDNDDAAKAFIKFIHTLAYNDDKRDRDSIAMYACDAAYQRTMAYSGVAGKFFDEATAEFSLRAA